MARKRRTSFRIPNPLPLMATFIGRTNARGLMRAGYVMLWMATAAALAGFWVWTVPHLQAAAARRSVASDVNVHFVDAPPWFRGEIAQAMMRSAQLQVTGDTLTSSDLAAIHEVLSRTGWFTRVHQVRRTSERDIEVTAEFALPYTVIRDEDADHLVDPSARLLPMAYPVGLRTDCVAITGVKFARPAQVGEAWEGADVAGALKLLRLIQHKPWRDQVREIDASAFASHNALKLVTDSQTIIIWGGAPGEESPLETLADDKLKRLDYLNSVHGRIDGYVPGTLDLTFEDGVFKQ